MSLEVGLIVGLAVLALALAWAVLRLMWAREALARSEAHFRADFEWAAVGKVHYDPVTGLIIRANKAHAAMLGYEPAELVGRHGRDFTWPEDRDGGPYRQMVGGAVETYAREKRYIRRDGTPVWGRVSASLVRAPDGKEPLLAVAVIEDVDDRYKAEMALAQAKQDLEAVVEQRTAALAQRDLLLREVYHRVKNNLQIVDSLMFLQAKRLADPEAKAALQTLRARVYAMGLVHHQLMGSADLETFDIAPFLRELTQHLLEGAAPDGIGLRVEAAPLKVGLDFAIPLGLLVTELVTASIQRASTDGAATIEVTFAPAEPGRLVLDVGGAGSEAERDDATLAAAIVDGLVLQLRGEFVHCAQTGHAVVRLPTPELA